MTQEAADDPFDDCELAPTGFSGHTPSKASCSPTRRETPVNVFTGETPAHSQASVEEATEFATGIDSDTPQIALPASVETHIETQSKPYTSAAFFHFNATGSLERHRAYHAAYDSDAYIVDFEADYESGDLTITVKRAADS